jgi:hypothetical protein
MNFKNLEKMRVIRINTTAWIEEDFYLVTTLDDDQIAEVIQPIVNAERDGEGEQYDNDMLLLALRDRFPLDYTDMYTEFDKLTF